MNNQPPGEDVLKLKFLENEVEIASFESHLKEGSKFELQRESGSQFHFIGTGAWNARDIVTVGHHGSAKGPVPAGLQTVRRDVGS